MFGFKKKKDISVFFKDSIIELHNLAQNYDFAKKGFIFNRGLLSIGENFVKESLRCPIKDGMGTTEFLFSMATSNMQMGVILGIQCGRDKNSIIDGSFFDEISDVEKSYMTFSKFMLEEYGVTQKQWDEFRKFIIPKGDDIIKPYINTFQEKEYVFKLQMAYYMLGVSIGIEKFEP